MREYTQARLDFIDKAIDGVYSPSQAKAELERLHQKYGDNVFPVSYTHLTLPTKA